MKCLLTFLLASRCIFCLGQVQQDLTAESRRNFAIADSTLQTVHDAVAHKHAGAPQFLKDLEASDAAWAASRDAELELRYPGPHIDGSFEYACVLFYHNKIVEARIRTLEELLSNDGPCPMRN